MKEEAPRAIARTCASTRVGTRGRHVHVVSARTHCCARFRFRRWHGGRGVGTGAARIVVEAETARPRERACLTQAPGDRGAGGGLSRIRKQRGCVIRISRDDGIDHAA